MEAMALGHLPQEIDIYSNSWGPSDNGILVDGPGTLTRATLEAGAKMVSVNIHMQQQNLILSSHISHKHLSPHGNKAIARQ